MTTTLTTEQTSAVEACKAAATERYAVEQRLAATRKELTEALNKEVIAAAEMAASFGKTYQSFIEACLENARQKEAGWSGGADSATNVIEAATRNAWLNAGRDWQVKAAFSA